MPGECPATVSRGLRPRPSAQRGFSKLAQELYRLGLPPGGQRLEIFVISAAKSCVDPLPALRSVPSPRLGSEDAKERWAKGQSPPCRPRDAGHGVPAAALCPPAARSSPGGGTGGGRSSRPYAGGAWGGGGGSRRRLQGHQTAPGFFGRPSGFSAEVTRRSAASEVALEATKLARDSVLPPPP